MFVKDSTFKMVLQNRKFKDLLDYKSIEVIVAFLGAITVSILSHVIYKQTGIQYINDVLREVAKNLSMALIGLLGFVVSGLAILTSSVSKEVKNILTQHKKIEKLIKIFLSFYVLAFFIGILIFNFLVAFIISYMKVYVDFKLIILWIFISSYLLIFSIFYAISLVGNCIQVFIIITNYETNYIYNGELTKEDKELYNEFKLSALETILLTKNIAELENPANKIEIFKELMSQYIESDSGSEEQKDKLMDYLEYIYKLED